MVMRILRIALPAATLFAALTGVNSQPITPSDVMAANVECGNAEAAAISASWTRDQTVAALNAVNGPMFVTASLSNNPATMAAWQALKAASEANVKGATGTAKELQDIADDRCKLAAGLIQRSHVEIKDLPGGAFVGIDYCSPISVSLSVCTADNQQLCRFLSDPYPTWNVQPGVGRIDPVTIFANNCVTGGVTVCRAHSTATGPGSPARRMLARHVLESEHDRRVPAVSAQRER